jgi:glycosyltransferase involved in cell wall biosynthesis
MRLLIVSPNPLDRRLGAAKVLIELGEALNAVPGVTCVLAGPDDVGVRRSFDEDGWRRFSEAQRDFLKRCAADFDIVDYDHEHLPFDRAEFDPRPLFVARSVLLVHYLETIRFPEPRTPRIVLSGIVHGRARASFQRQRIADATRTIRSADLVNVSNAYDRRELARRGVSESKVVVLPFGMSKARRDAFATCQVRSPAAPVVAFVGSFDFRKGAADFPEIFAGIRKTIPAARLALFGTSGHFRTADEVRAVFPRDLRPSIDIHPEFDPAALPQLLSPCSVGVFPSYCEGFGFGVLEMLAAAMPVVAYDAPGPPEMLTADYLVRPGDTAAMVEKVVALLRDRSRLDVARREARQCASAFDWDAIARRTVDAYSTALRRAAPVTSATRVTDVAPLAGAASGANP